MKLTNCFPKAFIPRPAQTDILKQVQSAFDEGHNVIAIQCPTGVGKSHIAASLVNYSKNPPTTKREKSEDIGRHGAFVLTITKYLQDQYEHMFDDQHTLKGKQNYTCNLEPLFNTSVAPCVLTPGLVDSCLSSSGGCDYYSALSDMLDNKFRVTNYSKYITLPDNHRQCDILICDEASEIEEVIVNYFSLALEYKRLYYLGIRDIQPLSSTKGKEVVRWLGTVKTEAELIFKDTGSDIRESIYTKKTEKDLTKLSGLKNLIDQIQLIIDNWKYCDFIVERKQDYVNITPLHIDHLASHLFSQANKVVFLSSTIYDIDCFTKTLGIKKYKYIDHPGVFDPKLSPIYAPCKVSLNKANLKQNLPIVLKQIKDIMDMYPNEKGIIHTHTNIITAALKKFLGKNKRLLFREGDITNQQILLDHKDSDEPTILVSPSLAFGVDLPDDLCRFQIIVKLPYPSLGDKRIAALAKESPQWYTSKMFTKLIQMSGRGTRNDKDHSSTFILDGNFIRSVAYNINKLPQHFSERLV